MIIEHLGKTPTVHETAYVAPNATVCGDVRIGEDARILHGACIVAEGGVIEIGACCIVLQNAVIRSTGRFDTSIGDHVLIGPHAHVVGCTIEPSVFVAAGASVFHGARLGTRSEVRVNGVVHLRTSLPPDTTVPIGWVAAGDPAVIVPSSEHEQIWSAQEPLNFPLSVYGVERPPAGAGAGGTIMPEVTRRLSEIYGGHRADRSVDAG